MADCEQVLQDEVTIYGSLLALGVDSPIAPPSNSAGGTEANSSESSLHFKIILVLRMGGRARSASALPCVCGLWSRVSAALGYLTRAFVGGWNSSLTMTLTSTCRQIRRISD